MLDGSDGAENIIPLLDLFTYAAPYLPSSCNLTMTVSTAAFLQANIPSGPISGMVEEQGTLTAPEDVL